MLRMIIAAAYRAKGKRSMSKSELTYFMSFDLKWFTHDGSVKVIEKAIEKGLLIEENGELVPSFDVSSVEIPVDFKPSLNALKSSIFEEIVEEIAIKTGKEKKEVVAEINSLQEKLEGLIDAEVAALVLAKTYNVDVSKYVEDVEKEILQIK